MKLIYAVVATLMLSLTACNSDNSDVICDANGCRNTSTNTTTTTNTVNTVNGCFVNASGVCQASTVGVTCVVNSARQCVPANNTVAGCTAFDALGNCISTTNTTTTTINSCTFRDRFGNCLPSICRFIDSFGRCIF